MCLPPKSCSACSLRRTSPPSCRCTDSTTTRSRPTLSSPQEGTPPSCASRHEHRHRPRDRRQRPKVLPRSVRRRDDRRRGGVSQRLDRRRDADCADRLSELRQPGEAGGLLPARRVREGDVRRELGVRCARHQRQREPLQRVARTRHLPDSDNRSARPAGRRDRPRDHGL